MQTERFAPLQAMLQASPRFGPGKYDCIKSLLRSMSRPEEEQEHHKWDLVGELLRNGQATAALQLEPGKIFSSTSHAYECKIQAAASNFLKYLMGSMSEPSSVNHLHYEACQYRSLVLWLKAIVFSIKLLMFRITSSLDWGLTPS